MKSVWKRRGPVAVILIVVLFLSVGFVSLYSIHLLQGNARVVNYVGIVRGATQKLIKEEIMGWYLSQENVSFAEESDWYPDDALIARLDGIVAELLTGEGANGLMVLPDEEYLANMYDVQAHWTKLQALIDEVRRGSAPDDLFDSSQAYFELVNETVFSAERYSERQVGRTTTILIAVNVIFLLLLAGGLLLYARSQSIRRRAEALDKIAYVDPLTKLDNRASCERLIERISKTPPDMDIAVFMFDMNDLKLTNDFLGHQGGDRVIAAFAFILQDAKGKHGFVGRFGGDEFIAVFEPGDTATAESFQETVRARVGEYNARQPHALEQIRYAVGYTIANPTQQDMEDILHDADNLMYANKRLLKQKQ